MDASNTNQPPGSQNTSTSGATDLAQYMDYERSQEASQTSSPEAPTTTTEEIEKLPSKTLHEYCYDYR